MTLTSARNALPVIVALTLCLSACTGRQGSGLLLTAIPLPAEAFSPFTVEPAALPGEVLLRANSIAPRGSGAPQLAVAFELTEVERRFTAKQIASLVLKKDTFPQCLLPDGAIVVSEGMLSQTPRFWAFSREGKHDITPKNLLDVVGRKHLPGVGVRFCDPLRTLYVGLRMKDSPDEIWVGREELRQVETIPDVISEATVLKDGGLRYAAMTSDLELHFLNPDTLAYEADPAFDWFSAALQADKNLTKDRLRHPVVTESIGAISLKEEIRIYGKNGRRQSIRKFSVVDELPSGLPRSKAAYQQILDNQLYLREEAKKLPNDLASTHTRAVIVSESVLALVDTDYCRVVFVSAGADSTTRP